VFSIVRRKLQRCGLWAVSHTRSFLACLMMIAVLGATAWTYAGDLSGKSADGSTGAALPEFSFLTDDGELSLESFRGQVVYVDFWASWCGPCRQSFPWMNEMEAKYKDKGLAVVGVSLDRFKNDALRFLDEVPADFTIAYDPEGALVKVFGVRGMPSAYVINRQGEVVSSHVGFNQTNKAQYEQSLVDALSNAAE